jgi:hypothetical protein
MGDVYGRKPLVIFGMIIQIICVSSIIMSTNEYILYIFVFFFGVALPAKSYVGFPYMLEFA